MNSLDQTVIDFLARHNEVRRLWVALSGGLDSTVLIQLIARIVPSVPVQVLHINHQLSPHASQWQAHCAELAESCGFPFICETVAVSRDGGGLEKAARDARYAAFERHLQPGDMLLMAHHQDDQAETLLLRLLRGAGVRGLGAMAEVRALGQGRLGRPLLGHSREELQEYAVEQHLRWVDDESNQSTSFDRNFLRHEILPLLKKRWPQLSGRWARTAELLQENQALLDEYAGEDLSVAHRRSERLGESIDLNACFAISKSRRNALLRYWVRSLGYSAPQQVHLDQVVQFFEAEEGATPLLAWGDCELRRFGGRLYLLPRLSPPGGTSQLWNSAQPLVMADGSRLSATSAGSGLRANCSYHLGYRQGGERCQPHNRQHSQTLKKLLQEYRLEPWLRDRVPLIYAGDELAAVGDLWVCRGFYTDHEPAWQVEWGWTEL